MRVCDDSTISTVPSDNLLVHAFDKESLLLRIHREDTKLYKHSVRVGLLARVIANEIGWNEQRCAYAQISGELHDIGKLLVPRGVLDKKTKLARDELEQVKAHCHHGAKLILDEELVEATIDQESTFDGRYWDSSAKTAAVAAYSHHERLDGSGYPLGLTGEDIPLVGRIVAIADVFDAMSQDRVYRTRAALYTCFSTINEGAGTLFAEPLVHAFLSRMNDAIEICWHMDIDGASEVVS